jgi:hypothetical protein
MTDSKTAILLLDSLPTWQKLNVTAFLATGIGDASPDIMGEAYRDAAGRHFTRLFGQPIVVLAASPEVLLRAYRASIDRDLTRAAYVTAMFSQTHGAAGREVFKNESPDNPDLVGLGLRGPRKDVDKATKGATLHP